MKFIVTLCLLIAVVNSGFGQAPVDTSRLQVSLDRATAAIRAAFVNGDVDLIARLHSPNIEKYFGGNNVVKGREQLRRQLQGWLGNSTVEFIENEVESTVFKGTTAVRTVIFAIQNTPKNGGQPSVVRGRSMLVFVQDKDSPTGWLTLREMTQEAPVKGK